VGLTITVDLAAPDATVLAARGEIDVYSSSMFREEITSIIDAGTHRLVLDIEGVEFLDSTGLGVLISALKRVRARDGSMGIVCTQPRILRVFKVSGLSEVFEFYATVGGALSAVVPDSASG
jgi:anti-sigma B factor antagonist